MRAGSTLNIHKGHRSFFRPVGRFASFPLLYTVALYFCCTPNMVFYSALDNFTAPLVQHECTDSVKYVAIHSTTGFGTHCM